MLNVGKAKVVDQKQKPQSQIQKWIKDCVHVWSCTSDVAKIIDRCGTAIKKISEDEDGVSFEIDRSAFRGAPYAFKVLK